MTRKKLSPDIEFLLQMIEEGYVRKAWHGPNLRGAIRGLSASQAAWRPGPGRHNIWENVVHAAYWKYAVRRRIVGEKRGSFPVKGSNWFERPVDLTEEAWRQDIELLDNMHSMMVEAIEDLRSSDLQKVPSGSRLNIKTVIWGIAAHDVYHAGQIQLLKRLMRRG